MARVGKLAVITMIVAVDDTELADRAKDVAVNAVNQWYRVAVDGEDLTPAATITSTPVVLTASMNQLVFTPVVPVPSTLAGNRARRVG